MRVFLDTNVLVSAFVSRGLCADLLKTVLEKHELVVSRLVLLELEGVLADKLHVPKTLADRVMSVLSHVDVVEDPTPAPERLDLDRNDTAIVMAAVRAGAEVFVTGDREILAAAGKVPMPIITPRRFMELLRSPNQSYPLPDEGDGGTRASDRSPTDLAETAFDLAVQIVGLCRELENSGNTALADALLRAGAGIGAALEGTDLTYRGRRKRARLELALQRAHGTDYWLRLLGASGVVPESDLEPSRAKCSALIAHLSDIGTSTGLGNRR